MLVNKMLAESMVLFSDTIAFGKKLGFDEEFLLDALSGAIVTDPFIQLKKEAIKQGDYTAQFPLEWMLKDIRLALETADEAGFKPRCLDTTRVAYEDAVNVGKGREDFTAVYESI